MNKSIGKTVSVIKGSNKVISSTDVDWAGIKNGSYFKLQKDPNFHTIANKKQIYFIKDFEVIDSNKIKINSNVSSYLIPGDLLIISFKEYELLTLLNIVNGGGNYRVDDIISLNGGSVFTDIQTGLTERTSFSVTEVNNEGSILSLGPKTRGKYLEVPSKVCPVIDGHGEGAVLEVDFRLIDDRKNIEANVSNIKQDGETTIVSFTHPLPRGIKQGKLSVEKWEITLNSNYEGETALNEHFHLCKNFTPYYNLPLAGQGSLSMDVLYNKSLVTMDDIIGSLEDRIEQLEIYLKKEINAAP